MDELIKTYTADIDLLLTEVCMTAAMHGQCTMPQLRPGALLWSARWARVVWQQRLGSLWKRMLLRCAAL